jgi:hypothetical protein
MGTGSGPRRRWDLPSSRFGTGILGDNHSRPVDDSVGINDVIISRHAAQ